MDIKNISVVLLLAGLALLAGLLIPARQSTPRQYLPWQIEASTDGSSRVFGLHLGNSTLGDAEIIFNTPAKISLFVASTGERVVEAYFDKTQLAGLNAKITLVLSLTSQQLDNIYTQGARISALGAGRNKVDLASQDRAQVRAAPIVSIDYIPAVSLSEETIIKRFGEPKQRVAETKNATMHWLYPHLGLDIARNADGKVVLQYVSPLNFSKLIEPLSQYSPYSRIYTSLIESKDSITSLFLERTA